ncbi:hypothetical protein K438DRAFT_2022034 [Mycena galopus ATCC 62051]|nr:hypothetical protein K438DRAFT_2022034 [Mycena galopus ATCC 62051]
MITSSRPRRHGRIRARRGKDAPPAMRAGLAFAAEAEEVEDAPSSYAHSTATANDEYTTSSATSPTSVAPLSVKHLVAPMPHQPPRPSRTSRPPHLLDAALCRHRDLAGLRMPISPPTTLPPRCHSSAGYCSVGPSPPHHYYRVGHNAKTKSRTTGDAWLVVRCGVWPTRLILTPSRGADALSIREASGRGL